MKTYTIFLLLCCLINIKCISRNNSIESKNNTLTSKENDQIEKIELREFTRGTNRLIIYKKDSLITDFNGINSQSEISKAYWANIIKQVDLLNLSKISSYKSPTTKRFSDSALSSIITITSGDKTYNSSSFDAGIPPKELEGLYELLKMNQKK